MSIIFLRYNTGFDAAQPEVEPRDVAAINGQSMGGLELNMALVRIHDQVDRLPIFVQSRECAEAQQIFSIGQLHE